MVWGSWSLPRNLSLNIRSQKLEQKELAWLDIAPFLAYPKRGNQTTQPHVAFFVGSVLFWVPHAKPEISTPHYAQSRQACPTLKVRGTSSLVITPLGFRRLGV